MSPRGIVKAIKGKRRKELYADHELVSIAELAARWHVSPSTVRRALRRADVQPFALSGAANGTLRYSLADIDEFLRMSKTYSREELKEHFEAMEVRRREREERIRRGLPARGAQQPPSPEPS
jgi:DNA-binding transcriptional regulator YhcF (GntR family)